MAEPYRITTRENQQGGVNYEGPFGPMVASWSTEGATPEQPGIFITGEHVERANLAWNNMPQEAKWGFAIANQAAEGVSMTIDGVAVRAHLPGHGFTRWDRQIRIERPGEHRRFRLRRWRTFSMETESGVRLIENPGFRQHGVVHEQADVIDVAVLVFLDLSGMDLLVRPVYG